MSINEILTKLDTIYNKLEEGFYSYGDFPLSEQKFLRNNPFVSSRDLEELETVINELDENLNGVGLANEVLDIIQEGTSIHDMVNFDEQAYASEYIVNHSLEADDLNSVQEDASQAAWEVKSELVEKATDDIKCLMEELLPKLIETK